MLVDVTVLEGVMMWLWLSPCLQDPVRRVCSQVLLSVVALVSEGKMMWPWLSRCQLGQMCASMPSMVMVVWWTESRRRTLRKGVDPLLLGAVAMVRLRTSAGGSLASHALSMCASLLVPLR